RRVAGILRKMIQNHRFGTSIVFATLRTWTVGRTDPATQTQRAVAVVGKLIVVQAQHADGVVLARVAIRRDQRGLAFEVIAVQGFAVGCDFDTFELAGEGVGNRWNQSSWI